MTGSTKDTTCCTRSGRNRRTSPRRWTVNVFGLASLLASGCVHLDPVSVAPNGHTGNAGSDRAILSADARYVVFTSEAGDLVPGDTNGWLDVFRRDVIDGTTIRISVADGVGGAQGNYISATSGGAPLSADARCVAFLSYSDNLVPNDSNTGEDVFVRDVPNGTTTRVSVASDGTEANDWSAEESLSEDCRFVAFTSAASNLVPDDTNGATDVFLHDLSTGETTLVSRATDGTPGNGTSRTPMLSGDGRYLAFVSSADNLVPGDTNAWTDVFVRDLETGTTARVSIATDGTQGNGFSKTPALSSDGRFVAFESYATNLVAGDANEESDIFLRDLQTGQTERISVADDGTEGDGGSHYPSMSQDTRYVAFTSYAENLVQGDTNGVRDVFVHDRGSATTTRVSTKASLEQANGPSFGWGQILSANGYYVGFSSSASNLARHDDNGTSDVFIRATRVPEIEAVFPETVTRGTATAIVLLGANLQDTVPRFGKGITIHSTWTSEGLAYAAVTIAANAKLGLRGIVVEWPGTLGPNTGSIGACERCLTIIEAE